ncbi:hypothetical protein ACFZC6_34940 [Streptomyces ossamyceticus]|jgi:hypothetical protein|uniref:Uncharacterized protein n=1 Tax=Streptomyces ossamyceticus TaxID=249581 RepID=A0ABV2UZ02_9ACTN
MGSLKMDEIVATVIGQISVEDVTDAAAVSANLEEDRMTFGPVTMIALDAKA